ncbi:hypothetical protein NQ318_017721 [Aromia moschata]|uniref:Uncharacterized protein n=1 Tax=Aromia moschata TaxID=1265417 RepID=A0AAV8XQB6_9CUCU|nr:hypothetical protein NQ318_017721 [Aromia moschata]
MKTIVLLLAFAFVSVNCEGESSSSSEEDLKDVAIFLKNVWNVTIINDIADLINRTEAQCPDLESKFEQAMEQVGECLEAVDSSSETFCSLIKKHLLKCAEPVRKAIDDCLPQESKGLPRIALKILAAVVDQACSSTVEEVLEIFNPCRMELEFTHFEACQKIKDVFQQYRNKLPSKNLVCEMTPKIRQCVRAHEEASCKNTVTKQALLKFHNAVERVTTEDCQDINKVK